MFARIAAIVGTVGAVTAPITLPDLPGHLDLSLLSAAAPLAGSDAAIIVGGTGIPTPSDGFAQSAENLYLNPLGFDGGATDSAVCDMSGTGPCDATLQVLTTPETTQWDQSMATGAADITNAVQAEFAANPGEFSAEHPLTVFAYSQGATDASIAMTQLAQDGVPSDAVHFVFIGDPSDVHGILNKIDLDLDRMFGSTIANWLLGKFDVQDVVAGNPGTPTPDDLYPTTDYTLNGDGFADFQPDYKSGGFSDVIAGMLDQHREYLGLTPAQIADATASADGDITNIDISDADVDNAVALDNAGEMGTVEKFFESALGIFIQDAANGINYLESLF